MEKKKNFFSFLFLLEGILIFLHLSTLPTTAIKLKSANKEPWKAIPGWKPNLAIVHTPDEAKNSKVTKKKEKNSFEAFLSQSNNISKISQSTAKPIPDGMAMSQLGSKDVQCSCEFTGVCLDKGTCVSVAIGCTFASIVAIFTIAWFLQWIVAIPLEWVFAKKISIQPKS